jgi:hypothetical protein
MKLKDILAISGKGGLYKFVSQGRNGIIVESYDDKKRTVVHSSAKVSALEDIAIFTQNEEVPLADVLMKLYEKENGKETISHKSSPDELKGLLEEILPDYDKERVYVSDMKKLVQWYNILLKYDLLKPEEKEQEEQEKDQKKEEKKEPGAKTTDKDQKKMSSTTKKSSDTSSVKVKTSQKPPHQAPRKAQKKG